MKFRRIAAGLTAALVLASLGSVAASPAQAVDPSPAAVESFDSAGTPPVPTKQDRPYKATTKDKSAKKGSPTGFSTFACPCFNYVVARQTFPAGTTGDGLAANLPVENTYLKTTPAPADNHTLAQLALQKSNGHAIEFGVTIDPSLFGNTAPHVFAGYRNNGVWAGYGVGFVDYAPNTTVTYGTQLPVTPGTQRRFEIKYSGGNFWLAYDLAWIGYIPASVFTGGFTNGDLFQVFMEEVGPNTQSCSDMGNGLPASNGSASRLGSMNITGLVPAGTVINFTASVQPATAIGYTATSLSATTVRGGGPGANAALTSVGTTGSC